MALPGSLHLSHNLGYCRSLGFNKQHTFLRQGCWRTLIFHSINRPIHTCSCKSYSFKCHSSLLPGQPSQLPIVKVAATVLARSSSLLQNSLVTVKLTPTVGIIIFTICGVGLLMYQAREMLLQRSDNSWMKSSTCCVVTSYLQPLVLWTGAIFICRALDPVILPSETAQVVKERVLYFVQSLSTVLAFAYCLSRVIQQAQKFFMESADACETRNMGFQFGGKAIYSAVCIAAFSLFMESIGFSTQKWVTAGGLGTVLLTLAGREIFTNFLSSLMIHATRPFVVNEWIRAKIGGYEVSGTVEHVGWWSPTIIRGEDREAVHIPNHKFTMNVVRNLSQKTHWRIKTHLAISHLDVNKINNIVADMRKVLAKSPQVEQQRLHRRVFLDNIHPENQALLILVSCFVKTSRYEEYLCVKMLSTIDNRLLTKTIKNFTREALFQETILLDLLRVIGHHQARLATPIRTLQKIYSDTDLDNKPYEDSAFTGTETVSTNRSIIIEPPYKISSGEKAKSRPARSTSGEADNKTAVQTKLDSNIDTNVNAPTSIPNPEVDEQELVKLESNTILKENLRAPDKTGSVLNDTQKSTRSNMVPSSSSSSSSNNGDKGSGGRSKNMPLKQPQTSRPVLEENIVLGVALEGSKRYLPIEEGIDSTTNPKAKEMAASQSGNRFSMAENEKDK